ncbi:hypothetical protein B0H13DRAFT_2299294 [Mycena leptocephala]|nr:hypothetical protein B0H13DRAFT_2299294 [Mycena leptocephala]
MSVPNLPLASSATNPGCTIVTTHIPPEIWTTIFLFSVSPHKGDWSSTVKTRKIIQQVSRLWREIACKNPPLWTTVFLKRFMTTAFVNNWLKRSGARADLMVEIDGRSYDRIDNSRVESLSLDDFCCSIVATLKDIFHRITRLLILSITEEDVRKLMKAISEYNGQKLHTLEIIAVSPQDTMAFPVAMPKAATLMNLTLVSVVPWWNQTVVYCNFITKLHLAYIDEDLELGWNQFRLSLDVCVALQKLTMVDVACSDWEDGPDLVLRNLNSFHLAFSDNQYYKYTGKIVAPDLHNLIISARSFGSIKDIPPIIPDMFASANEVTLYTQVYESDDIHVIFSCTNASLIDIRGCPDSAVQDLVKCARNLKLLPPSVRRLELKAVMEERYIVELLEGLGSNLTLIGPSSKSQNARIEWFLKDKVLKANDIWLA